MGSTYVSLGFCSIVLCVAMAAPRATTRDRSRMAGKQETENLMPYSILQCMPQTSCEWLKINYLGLHFPASNVYRDFEVSCARSDFRRPPTQLLSGLFHRPLRLVPDLHLS